MSALLGDLAFFDHTDEIGVLDCRQAVSDDYGGAP